MKEAFTKEDLSLSTILNVPNMISMVRILASIPLSIAVFLAGFPTPWLLIITSSIFLATDYFDGYFARKLNQKTKVGQILDPLGDKLLSFGLLVSLLFYQLMPLWTLIFPVRDIVALCVGKQYMKKSKDIMRPNNLARGKTFFLSFSMGGCIVFGKFTTFSLVTLIIASVLMIAEIGVALYNIYLGRRLNDVSHIKDYFLQKFFPSKKKELNENKKQNVVKQAHFSKKKLS